MIRLGWFPAMGGRGARVLLWCSRCGRPIGQARAVGKVVLIPIRNALDHAENCAESTENRANMIDNGR